MLNKKIKQMKQTHLLCYIFVIVLITTVHVSYSQSSIKCAEIKLYETPCKNRIGIVQKDSLQKIGEYNASIQKNIENLNDTANLFKTYYRLAVSYAKLEKPDSAFYYLHKYIDVSKDDRLIIVDKDFDVLRADSTKWEQIISKIENLYLQQLAPSVDKELALKLFYMGIEDQKYRVYLFALGQVPLDSTGSFRILASTKEIDELGEIIKKHGFPTISKVGILGASNAFLILQHSDKIVKYYRKVKKVYKQGEMDPLDFALITDRYLLDTHRKQLYGTQLTRDRKSQKKYPGKYILCPVKDFENVNERRKAIGFQSTVEEFVASWQDDRYIIPQEYYKKNRKNKK